MGLALALGFLPGEKFYVGDIEIVVVSFNEYSSAVVQVGNRTFDVTDQVAVEMIVHWTPKCR